jgi:biofilm PGA synthesis N-glycosyltransferase PgaC
MDWPIFAWSVLILIFAGVPFAYNSYMKKRSRASWNLKIDETYEPSVSILVPAHNEEKTIGFKLRNLSKLDYPADKMEIILVNDASTDATIDKIDEFARSNANLNMSVLNRMERSGKSNALNFALKNARNEVIVVSDADCFLSPNALTYALPYLSDARIGAVAGREMLLNPESSWVTRSESVFNSFVQPQRLGESKVYSTLFFQGGLAAYNRSCLEGFDCENDDAGTALNIVQGKKRTVIAPEAQFYTMFPVSWESKIALKMRRARQLQLIWVKCLKMLIKNKLVLPKKIAVPEIFLQIVNPFVFAVLIIATVWVCVEQPFFFIALLTLLTVALAVPKSRMFLIESVQNYLILLIALFSVAFQRPIEVWKTTDEARSLLNEETLRKQNLI